MAARPIAPADLVERSADPARVRAALERLAEARPHALERCSDDPDLATAVVAVLAASRSLTRLVLLDDASLDVLADRRLGAPPVPVAADRGSFDAVVRWQQLELLRIAAEDLTGAATLDATTTALSSAAGAVLAAAHDVVVTELPGDARLAVVGMGKLGAAELNYASDVDVLLVGAGDAARLDRAGRSLIDLVARCFRVDVDLRPEGRDGPLVRSLDAYAAYWARWAEPWERQALLKARPLAGDAELGAQWQAAAERAVWDQAFSADDLRQVRALKVRAEEQVRRRGAADRDVKRGRGGIRDIEFSAQLLELVHGGADPELRVRATVPALEALAQGGYIDGTDASSLVEAYRFLRRVEHVLQLDEGRQTHDLPVAREQRRHVARVVGFEGTLEAGPTARFDATLAGHRAQVRAVHERLWFRPLLDSFAGVGSLGPEAAADRLAALGFTDLERTRQAVAELTRGLTRSSRMMRQLLPLLLDWLSASPDPDLGLLALRRLASGEQRSRTLAIAFRESPEVARRLAELLGTSRQLADLLVANPDLIERLSDPARLRTRPRDELVDSATTAIAWRTDLDGQQRALQRWHHRHLAGIVARDLLGHAPVAVVGADLSALAEASLEAALRVLRPAVPFAVVAFGRLGGTELAYASDLDVAFVHDGGPEAQAEAERVALGLLRFVGGATPAERIWPLDASLRPEGRGGPLARSIDGWRGYLDRWADTWERQAHLRARSVAGDRALGDALVDELGARVWARPFGPDEVREVRRMKARIEQERLAPGEDPEFHLKLGRGSLSDIEFTVQLLQLRHGVPGGATMDALDALVEAGHLPIDEADVLAEAYRFCERTRNRSYLVVGPGDALPIRQEQITPLSRSLGWTVAGLRAEYRRVTRRARRVVERRFYGRD